MVDLTIAIVTATALEILNVATPTEEDNVPTLTIQEDMVGSSSIQKVKFSHKS